VHDVLILAVKGLAGGGLVVAFALLSEGLSPKRFAGLFSAAPAVALAGLAVVVIGETTHKAHENSLGMIAGGVGMIAYAAAVIPLLRRSSRRRSRWRELARA
jgi:phage terminase large subunit-like protein